MPEPILQKPKSFGLELQRFVRANASTLLATGVEWALVTAMVRAGGNYLIAAAAGALLGAIMDFGLKRKWAFMRRVIGSLGAESTRYIVVSALSLAWNLLTAFVLVHWLHVPSIPGVILASIVVGVCWNYPLHRMFVFTEAESGGLFQRAS